MDVFNAVLPVITLLVGAGLTQLQSNVGSTRSARHEARQMLADYWSHAWNKGQDDSWVGLLVYEGKLRGYLRAAGVDQAEITLFTKALTAFWQKIEDSGHEDAGLIGDQKAGAYLDATAEMLWRLLDDSWARRVRARRTVRLISKRAA